MIFSETPIAGAVQIDIKRIEDHRGFFGRAWCRQEFVEHGLNPALAQCNIGYNLRAGTVRGMHFQLAPHQEAKLVRCTMGAASDVVLDLRPGSPSFRKWHAVELTAENRRMLYIPEGCAHGYQTLVDGTEVFYQTTALYAPAAAKGVRHDDPAFGITWPLAVQVISDADRSWPDFVWEGRP